MAETKENDAKENDTRNRVESTLVPALVANYLALIFRIHLIYLSFMLTSLRLFNRDKYENVAEPLMLLVGIVIAGILPLWTKPNISASRLRSWNISPYTFTGAVLVILTILFLLTNHYMMQSRYSPSIPFLAALLAYSLLVNEIK